MKSKDRIHQKAGLITSLVIGLLSVFAGSIAHANGLSVTGNSVTITGTGFNQAKDLSTTTGLVPKTDNIPTGAVTSDLTFSFNLQAATGKTINTGSAYTFQAGMFIDDDANSRRLEFSIDNISITFDSNGNITAGSVAAGNNAVVSGRSANGSTTASITLANTLLSFTDSQMQIRAGQQITEIQTGNPILQDLTATINDPAKYKYGVFLKQTGGPEGLTLGLTDGTSVFGCPSTNPMLLSGQTNFQGAYALQGAMGVGTTAGADPTPYTTGTANCSTSPALAGSGGGGGGTTTPTTPTPPADVSAAETAVSDARSSIADTIGDLSSEQATAVSSAAGALGNALSETSSTASKDELVGSTGSATEGMTVVAEAGEHSFVDPNSVNTLMGGIQNVYESLGNKTTVTNADVQTAANNATNMAEQANKLLKSTGFAGLPEEDKTTIKQQAIRTIAAANSGIAMANARVNQDTANSVQGNSQTCTNSSTACPPVRHLLNNNVLTESQDSVFVIPFSEGIVSPNVKDVQFGSVTKKIVLSGANGDDNIDIDGCGVGDVLINGECFSCRDLRIRCLTLPTFYGNQILAATLPSIVDPRTIIVPVDGTDTLLADSIATAMTTALGTSAALVFDESNQSIVINYGNASIPARVINVGSISPTIAPDGLELAPNGNVSVAKNGVVTYLAPAAKSQTGFAAAIESAGLEVEFFNDGGVLITDTNGNRAVGSFAFEALTAGTDTGEAISFTTPTGSPTDPDYLYKVNFSDGSSQVFAPYPFAATFYQSMATYDVTVTTDRNTGVITISGLRLRPAYNVGTPNDADLTFHAANLDSEGVAYWAGDMNGDGIMDYTVITPGSTQVLYGMP